MRGLSQKKTATGDDPPPSVMLAIVFSVAFVCSVIAVSIAYVNTHTSQECKCVE